jgi:hypothetical protein
MSSLSRRHVASSTTLLLRILDRPGLLAAVRALPGAALGKLIDRIGLEDAGELVALASTAQLERIFDDDLWRADAAGGDETFRPDRFALWLRVMLEAGEEPLVRRLCELPEDLLVLAVDRLVLVLDMDVLADQLADAGEEAEQIERALETSVCEEWEEFRLIARDADAWDDVWTALLSLDRDHHDRLRAILERCCAMSTEYISGQGGLFQVLTSEEMLDSDVGAARDDRRAAEGFVSPADARAFLELARRGDGGDDRDAITRAYFRGLGGAADPAPDRDAPLATAADAGALMALLEGAPRIDAGSRDTALHLAPLTGGALDQPTPRDAKEDQPGLGAPLFEQAMNALRSIDPVLFSTRVRELGYLVNVRIAGGEHDGRRPRPTEALEMVLKTCEAGLRTHLPAGSPERERALAALVRTPADILFRQGRADTSRRPASATTG